MKLPRSLPEASCTSKSKFGGLRERHFCLWAMYKWRLLHFLHFFFLSLCITPRPPSLIWLLTDRPHCHRISPRQQKCSRVGKEDAGNQLSDAFPLPLGIGELGVEDWGFGVRVPLHRSAVPWTVVKARLASVYRPLKHFHYDIMSSMLKNYIGHWTLEDLGTSWIKKGTIDRDRWEWRFGQSVRTIYKRDRIDLWSTITNFQIIRRAAWPEADC